MPTEITVDRIDKPKLLVLVNEKITELYGWTVESLSAPVPLNDYPELGVKWDKRVHQYFKEAAAFRAGGCGGHNKMYHLVNMIKLDLPFFQFESQGYINSAALRVIKAWVENDDLAIAGAASTGKTYPVGACVLQEWKSAPDKTLAFVCTTSMGASEDRIWGAIVKMWQASTYRIGTYIPHKYVIAWGKFSESASDRDFSAAIKALAIERGSEGKKAIDTTRGRKQDTVILVFDELPEMETYVTQAAINLEGNPRLLVRGIGNPLNPHDAHGEMCRPDDPLGFKSINKSVPEWKTRTGWCIFLNGEWSPNFEAPPGAPIPFPKLTNRETLRKMLNRCHGNAESLEYYRNAIGFWPSASTIQTVLTIDLVNERGACEKPVWRQIARKKICGFDIGFTSGGDNCVAQFGEVGMDKFGRKLCNWNTERIYMAPAGGDFDTIIAKQVVDDCIALGVEPDGFGMDISGDGGKMLQAVIRYWITFDKRAHSIVPLSSMGRPSERIVSNVDPRKCDEAFDRKVTEFWMMVREAVLCEVIRGMPMLNDSGMIHPIVDQLCSRIYTIKGKKFSIERKDEMKKRTIGKSPDNADAYTYMIEMARRHGLVFRSPQDEKRQSERKKENREAEKHRNLGDYAEDSWGERDEEAA